MGGDFLHEVLGTSEAIFRSAVPGAFTQTKTSQKMIPSVGCIGCLMELISSITY